MEETEYVKEHHILSSMWITCNPNLQLDLELWDIDFDLSTTYAQNFYPQPEDHQPGADLEIITDNSELNRTVMTLTMSDSSSKACVLYVRQTL